MGERRLRTHAVGDPSTAGSFGHITRLSRSLLPSRLALRWGTRSPSQSLACAEVGGKRAGVGVGGVLAPGLAGHRGGGRQPLPASGELGSPDVPRGAASREQEPEAEQRPGPRAAHAAPGALRARPLAVATPSLPSPPARAASLPGRAAPGSQRSDRRAGGRRARGGGARSRPRPAPRRGPPPPAQPLPTRKEPWGGRVPQPGGPPGAHLSLAPFAVWPF